MKILATKRLILRMFDENDIDAMTAINQDPKVCEFLPELGNRQTTEASVKRIMNHYKEHGFGLYAVELKTTHEFIGWTGLSIPSFNAHFTPAIEIGWRLASKHWNQGYATEAARVVLDYAFNHLNLIEVVSFTVFQNKASRRVMEKIGLHYNLQDDFNHPKLAKDSPLCRHVLYRLTKSEYIKQNSIDIKIKQLSEEDIQPLSDAFLKENYHKTQELFKKYLQEQNDLKRSVWVAQDSKGNYLGYITVIWNSSYPFFSENNIPEINDFNVVPSKQNQGVGNCLIEHVEKIVAKQYAQVGLGVGLFKDYGPAQSLYIKRGYVPNKEGITYKLQTVKPFNSYPIDDDCVLWLIKNIAGDLK